MSDQAENIHHPILQDYKLRVDEYIQKAIKIASLYPSIVWENEKWDLTGLIQMRSGMDHTPTCIWRDFSASNRCAGELLHIDFVNFAKAYLVTESHNNKPSDACRYLYPLRALETALKICGNPCMIIFANQATFNMAAELISNKYAKSSANVYGKYLAILYKTCKGLNFFPTIFNWVNPIPRPSGIDKLSPESELRRQEMLPSEAGMLGIPYIYNNARTDADKIMAGILGLCQFTNSRPVEVLRLTKDALKEYPDSPGSYFLEWHTSKGAPKMRKQIPSIALDVIKDLFNTLIELCEPAREAARWIEKNPDNIYPGYSYSQSDIIPWAKASQIIGQEGLFRNLFFKETNLSKSFGNLVMYVKSKLPKHFPYNPEFSAKIDDLLILVFENEFYDYNRSNCIIEIPSHNQINRALGDKYFPDSSLFKKYNLTEEDGSPIIITAKQFRHLANTLLKRSGLNEEIIKAWSGRKTIAQSDQYDQRSPVEVAENVRHALMESTDIYENAVIPHQTNPITKEEFYKQLIPTAHVTEFGYCVRDFITTPCSQFRDCINCNSHFCEKTATKLNTLVELRDMTKHLLIVSKSQDDFCERDQWVVHHETTLERLERIIDAMNDDTIPIGGLIRIHNPKQFSPFAQYTKDLLSINLTTCDQIPKQSELNA